MPSYKYKAHDRKTNREVVDVLDAANQQEAITALKQQGLLPIEVKEVKGKSAAGGKGKPAVSMGRAPMRTSFLFGRVPAKLVTEFTRQLSTLQDAGLPIVQSLQILHDMQRPGPFKQAQAHITEEVQGGSMLSDAFGQFPKIWDRLYTNMIRAGETAGALEAILQRLADFREKAQKLRRQIMGAMIYPTAVISIAAILLSLIMIFIVPRFQEIFKDLGITLPGVTQFLIDTAEFMANWWWALLIGIVTTIVGINLFKKTAMGAALIDRIMLRVPIFGMVIRKSSVARFTRTLGTLVQSGVGFLDALEITKEATPNIVVRNAISAVRESVKEGETINEPLARSGVFNDIVVNMIKVGEETGELDKMLMRIADTYDEEVDQAVANMMSLLEPILILVLGGAVAFIVIALFMPLIKIINTLGSQQG